MSCFGRRWSKRKRTNLHLGGKNANNSQSRTTVNWRKFISARYEPADTQYDMIHVVGEGAYAKVFVGRDKTCRDGRLVAVKRMRKSPQLSSKIRTEIKVMKELDHPNICRLLETFEDENDFFFIMEYCEGGELFDAIVENNFLSENMTAHIVMQLARALRYSHGRRILHRDLKPENICLCEKELTPTMQIKVIDWGLASYDALRRNENAVGSCGSVPYVAPEVLLRKPYTASCDMWSLGVVTYIMLSGEPPFGGSLEQLVRQICTGTYNMGECWGDKPLASDFIRRLLAVNPDDRMTSEQVMHHPWILDKKCRVDEIDHLESGVVLENIQNYQKMSYFRAMCTIAIAKQMDHKTLIDIHRVFRNLDTNDDGVLSIDEVKEGFTRLFGSECGDESDIDDMFRCINLSGGGIIDYTEFCAAALRPNAEFADDILWAAFRSFDKNGDGAISKTELAGLLENRVGHLKGRNALCRALAKSIIRKYDDHTDGTVSFDDFKGIVHGRQLSWQSSVENFDEQCTLSFSSVGQFTSDSKTQYTMSRETVVEVADFLRQTSGLTYLSSRDSSPRNSLNVITRGRYLKIDTLLPTSNLRNLLSPQPQKRRIKRGKMLDFERSLSTLASEPEECIDD